MEWFQKILNFDTDLFLYLNSFHNDFWDTIMLMVTRKETWFPFFLVIIFYFIKNYRSKAMLIIILLALTILASDQISVLIKETVQRLRPVHEPAMQNLDTQCFTKRRIAWICFIACGQCICNFYFYNTYFQK